MGVETTTISEPAGQPQPHLSISLALAHELSSVNGHLGQTGIFKMVLQICPWGRHGIQTSSHGGRDN